MITKEQHEDMIKYLKEKKIKPLESEKHIYRKMKTIEEQNELFDKPHAEMALKFIKEASKWEYLCCHEKCSYVDNALFSVCPECKNLQNLVPIMRKKHD